MYLSEPGVATVETRCVIVRHVRFVGEKLKHVQGSISAENVLVWRGPELSRTGLR